MTDDGGPAFPFTALPDYTERWPADEEGKVMTDFHERIPEDGHHFPPSQGMSLRDWFAGQAIAGLLGCDFGDVAINTIEDYAMRSYQFADALLAERAKGRAT